jgi:hypothetical protein
VNICILIVLLIYSEQHDFLVPHLARCFENSFRFQRQLFDYKPSEKINILLHDLRDFGAGGATTIPWNYLIIAMEPFDYVYETAPTNERMNWLMHHELTHVVAMDKARGFDRAARTLFMGKVEPIAENPVSMIYSYFTNPRRYAPRWYHEGIAVFLETWMSGGFGRVLGGYDEMVFRTMVRDSSYFYDVVGLESEGTTIDFQIGANSYLYGTRFVSYLAYRYGPEKIIAWFNRTSDSKRHFAAQFNNVYGRTLDQEWARWIVWEREWQIDNLSSVRKNPTTKHHAITKFPLGSVSRAFYDPEKRKIYTAILYPGKFAQNAEIDISTGDIRFINEIPSPALYYVSALAYDADTGTLFYTTDNSRAWRDLHSVDVHTGESELLVKDARVGDLAFNSEDQSLWGVQHHNGYSIIVSFPKPYQQWQNILKLSYGKDIFDLDISPDGQYLCASFIEVSGRQQLIRMNIDDLKEGNSSFEVLFEFEDNAPANFVFSPDGKTLTGTSYYSGISNVYEYSFENKDMNILTNCETGYFRPVVISKDSLLVFRYSGEGFLPVIIPRTQIENVSAVKLLGQQIVSNYPDVKNWNAGPPSDINLDSITTYDQDYRAFSEFNLASAYPVVEGYKKFPAYGYRFNMQDPLGLHVVTTAVFYSPNQHLRDAERLHLNMKYRSYPWTVKASYNRTDFYDLFGPTRTSRKGNALAIEYEHSLISEDPKTAGLNFQIAGYNNLERLPEYQNVLASFDKYLTFHTQYHYSYMRRSLGAIEKEKGLSASLNYRNNYVRKRLFTLVYGDLDFGFPTGIDHSSIWLRSSAGIAFGKKDDPFGNFYFGGFGNNWIDYQSAERYREFYSFPGVELNEIGGQNYFKLLLEWTLPPIRFRRFGFTSVYFRWARLALFTSAIATNLEDSGLGNRFANLGLQLDFRLVTFTYLKSTLSIGYAISVRNDKWYDNEFMISFKIM